MCQSAYLQDGGTFSIFVVCIGSAVAVSCFVTVTLLLSVYMHLWVRSYTQSHCMKDEDDAVSLGTCPISWCVELNFPDLTSLPVRVMPQWHLSDRQLNVKDVISEVTKCSVYMWPLHNICIFLFQFTRMKEGREAIREKMFSILLPPSNWFINNLLSYFSLSGCWTDFCMLSRISECF